MVSAAPTLLSYEWLHDRAESLRRHALKIRSAPDRAEAVRVFAKEYLPAEKRKGDR